MRDCGAESSAALALERMFLTKDWFPTPPALADLPRTEDELSDAHPFTVNDLSAAVMMNMLDRGVAVDARDFRNLVFYVKLELDLAAARRQPLASLENKLD